MVESVIDSDRHLTAGVISAASAINLTLFFGILLKTQEYLIKFTCIRDLIGTFNAPVRIPSEKIIKIKGSKLLIEHIKSFGRSQISAPCRLFGDILAVYLDLLDSHEHIFRHVMTHLGTRAIETAVGTVESINKQIRRLSAGKDPLIALQILIHMMFTFHLPYKRIFSKEPVYILLKSAGHGINGTESIFYLILIRSRSAYGMVLKIPDQMLESKVVGNISLVVGIVYLILFGNAWTYERQLITDLHILIEINCRTHHR